MSLDVTWPAIHELTGFEKASWADKYEAVCLCGWHSASCLDCTALTMLWIEHKRDATKGQK